MMWGEGGKSLKGTFQNCGISSWVKGISTLRIVRIVLVCWEQKAIMKDNAEILKFQKETYQEVCFSV